MPCSLILNNKGSSIFEIENLAQLVGVEGVVVHSNHIGSSPLQLEFGCYFYSKKAPNSS
jgi:hypothetical protein